MPEGPVVHIGYPKAASSFLQKVVFPQVAHYEYIPDGPRLRDLSKRYWFEYEANNGCQLDFDQPLILSREHLTSPVRSMLKQENAEHRDMAVANLIHFFKDRGTILIVLRRQDSLVESLVRFKSSFFHKDHALFLDFLAEDSWARLFHRAGAMLMQSFDFCALVSQLAAALGQERIKLLLYEDLANRPADFLAQLGEVFEQDLGHLLEATQTPVNASVKMARLRSPLAAALNRRVDGRLEGLLPDQEVRLPDDTRRRLLDIYAPGNERLFRWFGLENRYGYY